MPFNRTEERRVECLREMEEFFRRIAEEREAKAFPCDRERQRAAALEWALREIEASRAALDHARAG
jgi:hypothetical protein